MSDGEKPSDASWDIDALSRLLRTLQTTDVDELEIVRGTFRLFVRRDPGIGAPRPVVKDADEGGDIGVAIVAPLTGVFYGRPTPEQAPFVLKGDMVEAGQVIALIETMKLFNEVLVEVAGEVLGVHANEGDLVEVGQVLFRVIPQNRIGPIDDSVVPMA